ncbi:CdaR family protein [Bdellovibrio bacteriovorus]|uniref:CdaR family protein n=1 Tax=Bdellovibrio bacteriovorus TaxID=959 RepID=UPI003AA81CBA
MRRRWSNVITENFSYKVVALFISLILWLTILGRRDFVLSKNIDIELITAPGTHVVAQTTDHIKVKVSGPRSSLKKFLESSLAQSITLDISQRGEGVVNVDIPLSKIEVPLGVRILGVRPNQIQAEVLLIKEKPRDEQENR